MTLAANVRARLDHPVIDGDAHVLELGPVFLDFVAEIDRRIVDRFDPLAGVPLENLGRTHHGPTNGAGSSRRAVAPWWVEASNPLDWASAALPALLHRRLDDLGVDFVVLYPTIGISLLHTRTDEVRQVACHAYNRWAAETFDGYQDRMRPVALLPMHDPDEALAELDHVSALGLGAVLIPGYVQRPVDAGSTDPRSPQWLDTYGAEGVHDYDPVWEQCQALRLPVTAHSPGMGWPDRSSPTNFSFNHIGHFAASGELLAKALFFDGVTRRFPDVRFGFLEGGVGVACRLYADLVGHWTRRGAAAIEELDPRRVDADRVMQLLEEFGDPRTVRHADAIRASLDRRRSVEARHDDFARAGITSVRDIVSRFVEAFSFGAEADDPMTPWAFARHLNPEGAALRVFFGSDIGHWDVLDFEAPLPEAYEHVEREWLTPDDFRAFVFENARDFYGTNPEFFGRAPFTDPAARPGGDR